MTTIALCQEMINFALSFSGPFRVRQCVSLSPENVHIVKPPCTRSRMFVKVQVKIK